MMKEYQVIWQREGLSKRYKKYSELKSAQRLIALMTSPEPWKVYGYEGDEAVCCSGHECGCGGKTQRDSFEEKMNGLPKLLNYEIREREVGAWQTHTPPLT